MWAQRMIEVWFIGTSLAVQWLGLHTSTAGGMGLIPGQGTKIPQAAQPKKKKKTKYDSWNSFYNKSKTLTN